MCFKELTIEVVFVVTAVRNSGKKNNGFSIRASQATLVRITSTATSILRGKLQEAEFSSELTPPCPGVVLRDSK